MVACPHCQAENEPSGPLSHCKKCGGRLSVSTVQHVNPAQAHPSDSLGGGSATTRLMIDLDTLVSNRLPRICIVCGRPSTSTVGRKFAARVYSTFGARIVRMKNKAAVPVCDQHRSHWWKIEALFFLVGLSALVLMLVLMVAGIWLMSVTPKAHDVMRGVFGIGGFIGGIVCFGMCLFFGCTRLRRKYVAASGFQGNCVILDNVSREFARACEQQVGGGGYRERRVEPRGRLF
jgi:hypothetical protein